MRSTLYILFNAMYFRSMIYCTAVDRKKLLVSLHRVLFGFESPQNNERLSAEMDCSSLSKLSSCLGEASELVKNILDEDTASSETSRPETSSSSGSRVLIIM